MIYLALKSKQFYVVFQICIFLLFTSLLNSQTIVSSLADLEPFLKVDNANVVLTPGVYEVTAADCEAGKFGNPLFVFEGSNSTYDFTGVTLNMETEVMRSFGSVDFTHLQILGNNNVIMNLTMVDIGDAYPTKRATSIRMDGQENLIVGLHMTVRGSFPYGYGDAFGKGGPTVIGHHKHSALLIRGYKNHIKDCTIIDRAYGHGIFMQAADEPLIENCYVEGEVRSTDDILAEEGTGSPADLVDFRTVWGYRLPPGHMLSLQEGGIRAYDAGTTYISGDTFSRAASNVTVLNCTIVNMRAGVTLAHAKGYKYVEGTTVLGCESGFAIGTGDIVNCYGDAKHGSLLNATYDNDRSINADITVIPSDTLRNGSGTLAYIAGTNNNIILRASEPGAGSELEILFGGHNRGVRSQQTTSNTNDLTARDINFTSEMWNPIIMDESTTLSTVTSCGAVFDHGPSNEIFRSEDCTVDCVNIPVYLKATCYDEMNGIEHYDADNGIESINNIQDGDWIMYKDQDINALNSIQIQAVKNGHGGSIELRLDDAEGTLVATLPVRDTLTLYEVGIEIKNIIRVAGLHDLYFVFKGEGPNLFDVQWFSFSRDFDCSSDGWFIEAECFTTNSEIQLENCSEGSKNISSINEGNWIMYEDINLSNVNSVKTRTATINDSSFLEIRIDSIGGTKIAEILVSNSGGWQTWTSDTSSVKETEGSHDVYLTFSGKSKYLFNLNSFEFSDAFLTSSSKDLIANPININIYPNPVKDRFQVSNANGASIHLFNVNGDLKLAKNSISDNYTIDVADFPKGIYFLRVSTTDGMVTHKIVKH